MKFFNFFYNVLSENIESVKTRDFSERVKSGKVIERLIRQFLSPILTGEGYVIRNSTDTEDMHRKVDFYMRAKNTVKEEGVQIKYRDEGKDILMEIVHPFLNSYNPENVQYTGRDMKGDSSYYAVLGPDRRTVSWCNAKELKDTAKNMTQLLLQKRESNPNEKTFVYSGIGEVRILRDPKTNMPKLMGFFIPEMFSDKKYISEKPIRVET